MTTTATEEIARALEAGEVDIVVELLMEALEKEPAEPVLAAAE